MATINLGMVTAYAYAREGGYTGTEADFETLLANVATTLNEFENFSATAQTLAAGASATASYSSGILTLGIPKGDTGATGNGIASVTLNGDYTLTITFTDGTSTTTGSVRGATGATPNLTIGTVTTGAVGADAAATITGTTDDPVLNLTLPRGATGDVTNLADTFSSANAYSAGDYVIYNDLLYVFTADHAAGAWTGSDAEQVTVGEELSSLKDDLEDADVYILGLYPQISVAESAVASFSMGADNIPVVDLVADIEAVQSGSGDPSPNNVRPITGFSSVNTTVAGKNLFDKDQTITEGYYINGSGVVTSSVSYAYTDYIKVNPSTDYIFSGTVVQSGVYNSVAFYDENKEFISRYLPDSGGTGASFTTTADTVYIRANIGEVTNRDDDTIQLEAGTTATTYEAYAGTTHTTSLGSTYYGGSLDVTTGVLTVTHGYVDLGTLTWTYNSGDAFFYSTGLPSAVTLNGSYGIEDAMCSAYKVYSGSRTLMPDMSIMVGSTYASPSNKCVGVKDSTYTDSTSFTSAVSGVYLAYKVATSTTVQLTATEVKTLLYDNNIWADSGDVTVTYRADLKSYIDSVNA